MTNPWLSWSRGPASRWPRDARVALPGYQAPQENKSAAQCRAFSGLCQDVSTTEIEGADQKKTMRFHSPPNRGQGSAEVETGRTCAHCAARRREMRPRVSVRHQQQPARPVIRGKGQKREQSLQACALFHFVNTALCHRKATGLSAAMPPDLKITPNHVAQQLGEHTGQDRRLQVRIS